MAKVDAVVMGGGRITDPSLQSAGCADSKSLIVLNGKPLVQWTLEALRKSDSIGRIVVVGPEDLQGTTAASLCDQVLVEEAHEVDSVIAGMEALPDSCRILLVAGNMPFLSPEAVDDFIENCTEGDVVYAAVLKEDVLAAFPEKNWTFFHVTEGQIKGTSAVLFRPQAFRDHKDTLRKVYDARKNTSQLVKLCGLGIALKFAMGQLSLADVERRVGEILRIDARSYISPYAELAFDVDKASDLAISERKMACR